MKEKKMDAKKFKRLRIMADFIKLHPDIWGSPSRAFLIKKWSEEWGVSRKTIIKDYVPIAMQWKREENAEFQTALESFGGDKN